MNLGLNPSNFYQHQVNENGKCVNCFGWRLLHWYRTKFSFLISNVHKMYDVWKRYSVRKSWELRGKVQENSMYLRPLPASSAPANTDAVIPLTFIWNCLSVCRSWTNSVLLKKMTPFKHITKACTVFTDATKMCQRYRTRNFLFFCFAGYFFTGNRMIKFRGKRQNLQISEPVNLWG